MNNGSTEKLRHEYEQAVEAPCHDGLTSLFNHSFFLLILDRELARSRRYGSPFVIVLLDINNFSAFNRDRGMLAGDMVLKRIANLTVEQGIRSTDMAARIAGDRFALLLLESTIPQAMDTVNRLLDILHKEFKEELSLSAGMVSYPSRAASRDVLLQWAAEALARAKTSRIDNICCHDADRANQEGTHFGKVLLVDDEPQNIKLMEALLVPQGYKTISVTSGEEALHMVNRCDIDLVLLDIMMPGMNGYEVCRRLKGSEATRMIPVVMVTGLDSTQAKVEGIESGADDFVTKPLDKSEILARTKALVNLKRSNSRLTTIENVLMSLANVVEAKDVYTEGHVQRVASMSARLGQQFGLQGIDLEALKIGGILHDVGKIAVPGNILNKKEALDETEWEIMQSHAEKGYSICLPLEKTLGPALDIIRHHHERLDGSGYPDGLKGEEITLPVRIMMVVDTYDAVSTNRPYRTAMDHDNSVATLRKEVAAERLDPQVVEEFILLVEQLRQEDKRIMGR